MKRQPDQPPLPPAEPPETYGLSWPGRRAACLAAAAPPRGRLELVPGECVGAAVVPNQIIEGDNLEVLKLLPPACRGQVKLIYIDPPYNTGAPFLYRDDFRGRRAAAGDDPGAAAAHRHADWLSLMYPRLLLARPLLRPDGFIAVSIDDNEAFHLRLLLDEVWGPENFVGTIVWKKGTGANDVAFSYVHELVMLYQASPAAMLGRVPQSAAQRASYRNPDDDPRGPWTSSDYTAKWSRQERPNLWYPIRHPVTGADCWPPPGRTWAYSQAETEKNRVDQRLWWGPHGRNRRPRYKRFATATRGQMAPRSLWDDVGTSEDGFQAFRELGFTKHDFPHPKPVALLRRLLMITAPTGGLVLDFFAGSGTTAAAVLAEAVASGQAFDYILVQDAEPLTRSGFPDLAAVCRERVRRELRRWYPAGAAGDEPGFRAWRWQAAAADDCEQRRDPE